jgi:hypothetical protein
MDKERYEEILQVIKDDSLSAEEQYEILVTEGYDLEEIMYVLIRM